MKKKRKKYIFFVINNIFYFFISFLLITQLPLLKVASSKIKNARCASVGGAVLVWHERTQQMDFHGQTLLHHETKTSYENFQQRCFENTR